MENAKQFLTPQSMLTPGLAGAIAMMITNTLTSGFELAKPWPAVIAIVTSFVLGLLVWASEVKPYWKRLIYYVANSFIIFNVAIGANTLGQAGRNQPSTASILVPEAHAQPADGWCCLNNRENPSSREECDKWGGLYFSTQKEAQHACRKKEPAAQQQKQKEKTFFNPWF